MTTKEARVLVRFRVRRFNNSGILYSFSGIGIAPVLRTWAIKIFSESYVEYIGKKGQLGFTYRYSPWTVQNNTIFLCHKWLKSENGIYKQEKDVLTDLMKRDASGNSRVLPCIFSKRDRADVGSKSYNLARLIAKLISKRRQLPAWSNGCDTIERFELSFNGQ